jgi:hypothetical protein
MLPLAACPPAPLARAALVRRPSGASPRPSTERPPHESSHWRTPDRVYTIAQILGFGLVGLGAGWPLAFSLGWPLWIALPVLAAVLGSGIFLLHRAVAGVAGGAIARATGTHGGGRDTRAHVGMSAVDALVVRGRLDEAIDRLRVEPLAYDGQTGAEIAQRLADLLVKAGQHEEAAQVYRRARRCWDGVSGAEGRERRTCVTRRLLDLYGGPLANAAAADRECDRLRAA